MSLNLMLGRSGTASSVRGQKPLHDMFKWQDPLVAAAIMTSEGVTVAKLVHEEKVEFENDC